MTKHQRRAAVCFLPIVLLLAVADASAQDKGKTGITMGYPPSVGFVFHVSDRLAIRPELDLSVSSGESDSFSGGSGGNSSDGSRVGVGFSALFYLRPTDKLRPYVAPRYVFAHTNSSSDSPLGGSESTITSHAFGGFFGAQSSLHDRFSVFGEVGVIHTFGSTKSELGSGIATLRSESRVTSARTGVGVIFYF